MKGIGDLDLDAFGKLSENHLNQPSLTPPKNQQELAVNLKQKKKAVLVPVIHVLY